MEENSLDFSDDLYKYDSQNYKKFMQLYVEDLRTSYNRSLRSSLENIKFNRNIIIAGSSWSLNASKIVGDYLNGELRLLYSEAYDDTVTLTKEDVVIAISYSGNSEEALAWLKHARRVGAKCIIITSGGRLAEESFDFPVVDLPKGVPSRCSTFLIIGTLLRLFEDANLIPSQLSQVQEAVDYMRSQDVSNIARDLSLKLYGVIPLIYGSSSFKNVSFKFKRLINANAKTTAFCNTLPGADYYEAESFQLKNATFHAVILSGADDISRLRKKTGVFKEALQSQGVAVTELNVKSKGLTKIVSALMFAEFTSYYLALRYKKDPLGDEVTGKIKKDMGLYI